ncbi:hypothetical protein CK203_061257 [Vitis vinifera]|uniref:Uncharacterized protein n=1 Tax=Vitis vinifera TaxID=29760 RepID=A0A438G5B1_VITVI|nr:hypothetical protein CK203_105961 [Vitis vinifera]RVW67403.1 hypothetical protein CK203_061257 [Vitis vinifera]
MYKEDSLEAILGGLQDVETIPPQDFWLGVVLL